MTNITELDLPIFDLYKEFNQLLDNGIIRWFSDDCQDQICLNSTKNDPDNFLLGRASLWYDWDKFYEQDGKIITPLRKPPLKENQFTELCSAFKGTLFEEVYNILTSKYQMGRIRIMNSQPKTCLTWHNDDTTRIHYPMKTQEGCFMIIEDEVKHLEKYKWYHTNTTVKHTAMNASKENRIHLVGCILDS